MYHKNTVRRMGGRKLDSYGSGKRRVAGFFTHGKELLDSTIRMLRI